MTTARRTLGIVIGERRLNVRDAPRKTLVVTLGKPRRMKGGQVWECPFRIKGTAVAVFEFGYGVDALQALTSALEGIRVKLDQMGKPLAWSGVLPDHSGFQRMVPMLPGISERLERALDRELHRELRRLERRQKQRPSTK